MTTKIKFETTLKFIEPPRIPRYHRLRAKFFRPPTDIIRFTKEVEIPRDREEQDEEKTSEVGEIERQSYAQ